MRIFCGGSRWSVDMSYALEVSRDCLRRSFEYEFSVGVVAGTVRVDLLKSFWSMLAELRVTSIQCLSDCERMFNC